MKRVPRNYKMIMFIKYLKKYIVFNIFLQYSYIRYSLYSNIFLDFSLCTERHFALFNDTQFCHIKIRRRRVKGTSC